MHATTEDDRLLSAWHTQRDSEAFRRLCERYAGLIEGVCRRQRSPDTPEAVQAVFLVLARRAGAVRGASLGAWLAATAQRVVLRQQRSVARRRRHEQEAAVQQASQHADSEPVWVEAREHLDEALASLSAGRREAILRFYLAGRPQTEVAAELGCSVAAVKMRVHEGLEGLRVFFARKGIACGAGALASGLASEVTASDPTLVASCVQTVLTPAAAPGAAALANGVITTMFIKTSVGIAAGIILAGSCFTVALVAGAEAVPAPTATTSSSSSVPDPHLNAALSWWRALYYLNEDKERLGAVVNLDPLKAQLPDAAVDAVFSARCRVLDLLASGSANAYCDWGINVRTEGVSALLPYGSGMRQLIRMSLLRARWHALGGRPGEAVDDLLVAQRTARLLAGRNSLLIDILGAYATERQGIAVAGTPLDGMPSTQRQRLRTGFEGFPTSTTVADALDIEVAGVHSEIDQLLKMPVPKRSEFLNQSRELYKALSDEDLLQSLTDEHLREVPGMYSEEVARWQKQLRLPAAQRGSIWMTWSGGEPPHPLLAALVPAIEKIATTEVSILQGRQQLQAAIAYLADGDAGLAQFPDVITGKPFQFQKQGDGFQLSAVVPGQDQEVVLRVEATAASVSPTSQPSDF